MIPRYSLPEIADLFTDEARFGGVARGRSARGRGVGRARCRFPKTTPRAIRERAGFDVEAIAERERVTDHDVAAFVDVVQERVGAPAGAWVHYGLTSSDVVDTALALQMTRALDRILEAAGTLEAAIAKRAREFRDTPMVGRTHGIHAEPTTFGAKLALWALQVRRDRERLTRAREHDRGRQAFGRGRHVSRTSIPFVEQYVCEQLGLRSGAGDAGARPRPPRRSAVRVRVGRRDDRVVRARDPAPAAHRGARGRGRRSARASKRARARCRTSGTRSSRSNSADWRACCAGTCRPALENVALWHERDISHSSVERIIIPDSLMLAYYELVQFTRLDREPARVIPSGCCATSTRRSVSCSASRCCSR